MSTALHAEARQPSTKSALRQLRKQGKVPGVVYGKELGTGSAIALDAKELGALLRGNARSILELEVPEQGSRSVLLSDLQRDPISGQVLHVDFRHVNLNESIQSFVRLDFQGVSPGEKEGGMLQAILHELEVECVAKDLPSSIPVDIGSLGIGDHITVGDLKLPAGVSAAMEPESVVVAVLAPQKERSEDELEAMDDAAEENENHERAALAVEKD
ncbi:50S ribosomal protein L25 [Cohnella thailandensis]|jgi:ribosomal protein L25, Ctc-form|uniref:Large ribosomal subunit protein bL25 n=1 Tax=Cohnella thailandensis TaxID=557557 RepID=A0A841T3T7_9BACL|nr:50S ribosomal protein L25 [Cohnella thailandensis]MBB6638282.1 50S ribosomal protein L25 [Cohnella thailandensis]MBP1977704.1 large subunit ribosomal protein L25 [Cohnella thailandensis]